MTPRVVAFLLLLTFAGCGSGSGSSASSVALSPQQSANARLVDPYIQAVNQALVPLRHPPSSASGTGQVERLLRTAVARLKQLGPPTGFTRTHNDVIHALEAQLAAATQLGAALRSSSSVAQNEARASATSAASQLQTALAGASAELAKCKANGASC